MPLAWNQRTRSSRFAVVALAALAGLVVIAGLASDPVTSEPIDQSPTETQPSPEESAARSVPDVVGMDLQTAQDTLQSAGYRSIKSIDDTGRGRYQMNDSNWVVVSQSPKGMEEISTAYEIRLFVVKDGEQ